MPTTEPIRIEFGNGDARYGSNNDIQPLLPSLKVMTYNIHILNPPSKPGTTDINATADVIIKANPDVVFLQEVDKKTGRNGYTGDQAEELAKLTKMNVVFYSAIPLNNGFYGTAILSKYPLKTVKKYLLHKEKDTDEQRVLGTAVVDLPGVDSLTLAVTHLQHNSATNRVRQVRDLTGILDKEKGRVIIGGDLNEKETATEFFSIFDGSFTRTCKGSSCPLTSSAQSPKYTIDYLAYKPAGAFSVREHTVINEPYASDHFPVVAELNINR